MEIGHVTSSTIVPPSTELRSPHNPDSETRRNINRETLQRFASVKVRVPTYFDNNANKKNMSGGGLIVQQQSHTIPRQRTGSTEAQSPQPAASPASRFHRSLWLFIMLSILFLTVFFLFLSSSGNAFTWTGAPAETAASPSAAPSTFRWGLTGLVPNRAPRLTPVAKPAGVPAALCHANLGSHTVHRQRGAPGVLQV
jgi:hypothetical protein